MALDINVNNNVNKAIEAMSDAKVAEEKKADKIKEDSAISAVSEQGDRLNVTADGADSARVGGTVVANGEDGLVAEQNEVSIEANEEAIESMRAQIQETRENQARAMEKMKETAEANAERASERNELRDADNEAAKARKDLLIEEAEDKGNPVVETAKEHVDNLTGLSKDQVEQLYRDGRISRYEYQQNMEAREASAAQAAKAGEETAQLTKETLADEAVIEASEALVTAVGNGNGAVMEAALGINNQDDQAVRAIMS